LSQKVAQIQTLQSKTLPAMGFLDASKWLGSFLEQALRTLGRILCRFLGCGSPQIILDKETRLSPSNLALLPPPNLPSFFMCLLTLFVNKTDTQIPQGQNYWGLPLGLWLWRSSPGSQIPHLVISFTLQSMTHEDWQSFIVTHLSDVEMSKMTLTLMILRVYRILL
jgi:hypothetical protein